jgi:hypothetical protein
MRTLRTTGVFVVCLALLAFSVPLIAADAEIAALDRAKALLASRGRLVASVIIVDKWPSDAPVRSLRPGRHDLRGGGGNVLWVAV